MSVHETFLSCDWGTSHFRLRLIETATLTVLAELKTGEGIAHLGQNGSFSRRGERFSQVLAHHAGKLSQQAGTNSQFVVVSGMVSSSLGWMELPYVSAPLTLSADGLLNHVFSLNDFTVTLVSGVRTTSDVMRGEECEILGLAGLLPDLVAAPACLILPGTHSKHIRLNGSVLVDFTTHMTGEIYAQLQQTPTLQAALSAKGGFTEEEFIEGVSTAKELGILAALFKIRARSLISGRTNLHGHSFLSGVLIGSELLSLPADCPIFLGCAAPLCELYTLASVALDIPLNVISPTVLTTAVLSAHRAFLPRLP